MRHTVNNPSSIASHIVMLRTEPNNATFPRTSPDAKFPSHCKAQAYHIRCRHHTAFKVTREFPRKSEPAFHLVEVPFRTARLQKSFPPRTQSLVGVVESQTAEMIRIGQWFEKQCAQLGTLGNALVSCTIPGGDLSIDEGDGPVDSRLDRVLFVTRTHTST